VWRQPASLSDLQFIEQWMKCASSGGHVSVARLSKIITQGSAIIGQSYVVTPAMLRKQILIICCAL
jgi:hypothetical protein